MDILKPCPFCGGTARLKIVPHVPVGYDYIPQCNDASCAGRLNKKFGTKDVAIYAWNRRKSEQQTGEWIEEPGKIPKCSICGIYSDDADKGYDNFCPNCGTKMFESQERSAKE